MQTALQATRTAACDCRRQRKPPRLRTVSCRAYARDRIGIPSLESNISRFHVRFNAESRKKYPFFRRFRRFSRHVQICCTSFHRQRPASSLFRLRASKTPDRDGSRCTVKDREQGRGGSRGRRSVYRGERFRPCIRYGRHWLRKNSCRPGERDPGHYGHCRA